MKRKNGKRNRKIKVTEREHSLEKKKCHQVMTKHTYSCYGEKIPEIIKNQGSEKQELAELREDMEKKNRTTT